VVLARHARNKRLAMRSTCGHSPRSASAPAPARSTTTAAPPATPTTRRCAPSATTSSASSTAAWPATPPTTSTPPGHTAPVPGTAKPLDSYSRGMSRRLRRRVGPWMTRRSSGTSTSSSAPSTSSGPSWPRESSPPRKSTRSCGLPRKLSTSAGTCCGSGAPGASTARTRPVWCPVRRTR
jgi:hypothetical protein